MHVQQVGLNAETKKDRHRADGKKCLLTFPFIGLVRFAFIRLDQEAVAHRRLASYRNLTCPAHVRNRLSHRPDHLALPLRGKARWAWAWAWAWAWVWSLQAVLALIV